jgi:hypothetical protein
MQRAEQAPQDLSPFNNINLLPNQSPIPAASLRPRACGQFRAEGGPPRRREQRPTDISEVRPPSARLTRASYGHFALAGRLAKDLHRFLRLLCSFGPIITRSQDPGPIQTRSPLRHAPTPLPRPKRAARLVWAPSRGRARRAGRQAFETLPRQRRSLHSVVSEI